MTEKRKPLTRRQVLELCILQEGRCGCGCGKKLEPMSEGVIDEHFNPLGLTGTNDLENRKLFRKPCANKKTDEEDKPRINKAKRQAGETGQWARRKANGPKLVSRNEWPKGRKLESRPFSKPRREK